MLLTDTFIDLARSDIVLRRESIKGLFNVSFQLTDDEHDSDREVDLDESADLSDIHWHDKSTEGALLSPHPSSNLSLSLPRPLRSERSGRDSPASVDSIPLEWDHDYDLSRDLETAVAGALRSEEEEGQGDKDFYLRGAASLEGINSRYLSSLSLCRELKSLIIFLSLTFRPLAFWHIIPDFSTLSDLIFFIANIH